MFLAYYKLFSLTIFVNFFQEKSVEKVVPNLSEPPSTSSASKQVPVPLKESGVTVVKPSTSSTTKEKSNSKKTSQTSATNTTQIKSSSETSAKVAVKEIKAEPGLKLRNPKHKNVDSDVLVVKQEIKVEKTDDSGANESVTTVPKEKKKRVVPRVQKKEIPMVKGGKVDCLANSRQKRVIKERLKTVAESIKARSKSSASSLDGSDKVCSCPYLSLE